jgi:hypothetical protein
LRTVVGKALQTRVADRYSGAQEFKDHLVRAWQVTTLRLDAMEKAAAAEAVSRTRRLSAFEQALSVVEQALAHMSADADCLALHTQLARKVAQYRRQKRILLGMAGGMAAVAAAATTAVLHEEQAEILLRPPTNVTVQVDGKLMGTASPDRDNQFPVAAGKHAVVLAVPEVPDLRPMTVQVDLRPGERGHVIDYIPPIANVEIVVNDRLGQECVVDGRATGYKAPCIMPLKTGEHTFQVGDRTWTGFVRGDPTTLFKISPP